MTKATYKQVLTAIAALFILPPVAVAGGISSANQLDGGFVVGMTPAQTCELFKKNYKNRSVHNKLCRSIDKKDFTNLTVTNSKITRTKLKGSPITAVSFEFDANEKLARVVAKRQPSGSIGLQID